MESFKITIDGRECEAKPGQTVLEVAEENGILIPVFCYHRELRPEGACRVCLVEVEGAPRLATACTLKASPNMVVKTNTERVKRARRNVIELILNNHTLECPICDRSGECQLQDIAYQFGPKKSRYREPRREKDIVIKGPLIEIDNDRCILCRRCIRMCGENMGNRVLGILKRGYQAYISPFKGDFVESGCEHCGSCVDICPVGSLLDRAFKYRDRAWRVEKVWTTCSLCGSGCSIEIDVYKNRIKRAVGRIGANNGHNRGYLCVRGRWGWDHVYSERRLRTPLLRKDGTLTEISWEEAYEILVSKIKETRSSANLLIGSSLTNEELNAIGSLFNSENVTSDSLTVQEALRGISEITGNFSSDTVSSINSSEIIVVIGDFIEYTNPVVSNIIRLSVLQESKKLLRIGSSHSKLDRVSFVSIVRPESELLDVIKHVIMFTFDSSYKTDDKDINRLCRALSNKKVTFIIGGTALFSPDVFGISKSVAMLSSRLTTTGSIIVLPPKANSLGVVEKFEIKPIEELKGSTTFIFETSIPRDFPGASYQPEGFKVVFSPFYTTDVSLADLAIPVATCLEKDGTFTGIGGTLHIKSAVKPEVPPIREILETVAKRLNVEINEVKAERNINIDNELPSTNIPEHEMELTVVFSRTGYGDISYYSENIAKVSEATCLLLNPSTIENSKLVTLTVKDRSLNITAIPKREIPEGKAVLRVERMTPEISEILKGYYPFMSGIPCHLKV